MSDSAKQEIDLRHLSDTDVYTLFQQMSELDTGRKLFACPPWAHGGNWKAAESHMKEVQNFIDQTASQGDTPLDEDSMQRLHNVGNLALCESFFDHDMHTYIVKEFNSMNSSQPLDKVTIYINGITALGEMMSQVSRYLGKDLKTRAQAEEVDNPEFLEIFDAFGDKLSLMIQQDPDAIAKMMREATDESLLQRLKDMNIIKGDYSAPHLIEGLPLPDQTQTEPQSALAETDDGQQ